jgi:hypothetical protein
MVDNGTYKKWVEQFPDIVDNLHQWVLLGGSLYMSDLAWVAGERAFPDAIDFWGEDDLEDAQVIEPHSTFDAALVDASLAEYVGAMGIQVTYDSGPLISVSAAGEGTTVHAMGHIEQCTSFWDDCLTDVVIDEDQPVLLSYQPVTAQSDAWAKSRWRCGTLVRATAWSSRDGGAAWRSESREQVSG